MTHYAALCAKRDFRRWKLTEHVIGFIAALSNLLLAAALSVNCLLLLAYFICSRLGPGFAEATASTFHLFVYGCTVLFLLISFAGILTYTHSQITKEVAEDVKLREQLYQEVVAVTG